MTQTAERSRPKHIRALLADLLPKGYPVDSFPLSPHPPSRRFYRKISQRRYYFGTFDDPMAALREYERQAPFLHDGITPPPAAGDRLTVRQLVNTYLNDRMDAVEAGELRARTYRDYHRAGTFLVEILGAVAADDLTGDHFARVKKKLDAKKASPVWVANEVGRIRQIFNFALERRLISKVVDYGPLKPPRKALIRTARNERPRRFLDAKEVRALLDLASPKMRAAILLGVGCGLGNADVGTLRLRHLDLDAAIIDFARGKTGIERRAVLWPETVEALRAVVAERPKPADEASADLVFLTKFGRPMLRQREEVSEDRPESATTDAVGQEFKKLLRAAGIDREGVGFYALRHICQSIGERTRDFPAVSRVLGHADKSMSDSYRAWRRDDEENRRLSAVADEIRAWLFGQSKDDAS